MADASTGASLSTTTNVTAGTVGSFTVAKWALACFVAGKLTMPDDGTLSILCGALMPFGHMIYLGFAAWFSRKAGLPAPAPVAPAAPVELAAPAHPA